MTDETIVAVYDTPAHAAAAVRGLQAANIPQSAISQHAQAGQPGAATHQVPQEQGFWSSLFGGEPDHDTTVYDRSITGGATVVSVKVSEAQASRVVEILEAQNPVDLDDRALGYGLSRTATGATASAAPAAPVAAPVTAAASGDTLKLVEERLQVGKRVVNRGGARIRRFTVETPAEAQITLHDEKVTLERHAVTPGQPVANPDFSEKTIEMTETGEEAVVSKQAFVTEEISLRKEATERVETVRDTVRREEVDVEQLPGERVAGAQPAGTGAVRPPKV